MKYFLCVVLFFTIPASATIANVQSNATWTCPTLSGNSIICTVTLTTYPTTSGNMLAAWTFWQSTFPYTATVTDSKSDGIKGIFPSAVGPTVQPNTTVPTNAQIFYAANITGTGVGNYDKVTVTFTCPSSNTACGMSPTLTTAGVVAAEYSGADIYYPLDSFSAGYSTSGNPTTLLDSGTVAPANSNFEVFGAGITTATGGAVAGSNFTSLQSASNPSLGSAIVEDNTNPITGNNVLWRATASSSSGTWLMQMAIFRDASWTVASGWAPVRNGVVRYCDPTRYASLQACVTDVEQAGGGEAVVNSQIALTSPLTLGTTGYPVHLHIAKGGQIIVSVSSTSMCTVSPYCSAIAISNGSGIVCDSPGSQGNGITGYLPDIIPATGLNVSYLITNADHSGAFGCRLLYCRSRPFIRR